MSFTLAVSPQVLAQASAAEPALPAVQVTGSRFASDPAFEPLGATVISAEQIREAGVSNINEAIRRLGNVYGRQGLSVREEFSLDLRGFGASSDQNIVVLVDGIRISESEQAVAQLTAIPVDSVERIEIVRGGSSVLYGEGATGGTINVITKRGGERNAQKLTLFGEVGGFNYRNGRVSATRDWNGLSMSVNASKLKEDGYRRNSSLDEQNLGFVLQQAFDGGRMGLRVEDSQQDFRLPGALSFAQFQADPRQSVTPNDFGSLHTRRYTFLGERRVGEVDLAAELSNRDRTARSRFGGFPVNFDNNTTQFSPRARWLRSFGAVRNELVAGVDLSRWSRDNGAGIAAQDSRALYLRDEFRVQRWRFAAGARQENFRKRDTGYDFDQSVRAWELQAAYAAQAKAEVYAKFGSSYRMPNADDLAFLPRPLAPQTSRDTELGAVLGDDARKLAARLFRHELRNEIFFDPTVGPFGANVNLDPTRREGVELEGTTRLSPSLSLSAAWQYVRANFTEGPNSGREMVQVPRHNASLRARWAPGGGHTITAGIRYASEQRFNNDFANTCGNRIPSYAVLDARYAYRTGPWEFAATGTNLADRSYYSNAFSCTAGSVYPEAGRQLRVSVRREF